MASPSTHRTSRHRWFVAFAAVGICLALAGCGASTTKGDGNPPLSSESATSTAPDVPVSSSAATTAAASAASASVASSSSAPPVQPKTTDDGCSVLSDDEVTAVIGVPVTRREASAESAGSFGCVKGNDRATDLTQAAFVSFSAFTAGGVALLDELAGQGGTEEISGLGERALYQAAGGFVFVLQGGTVVSVQVYKFGAPGSRDEVIGLARIALSRVP